MCTLPAARGRTVGGTGRRPTSERKDVWMDLLQGATAIVTGAAQGIGFASARMLCEHGANVLLTDIDETGAKAAAEALRAVGGSAQAMGVDVTRRDDLRRAVSSALERYGSLDVLVNNAGVPRDRLLAEMTTDDFDAVIDVHLRGTWFGVQAAAAAMQGQGSGSIVNISSISGKVGFARQTNYSAAKAGVVGLTKAAAKELGEHGIRVNAVAPGTIRSERTATYDPAFWAAKVAEVPLRREGTPEEVAGAVLFLASSLSSYITGTVVEVAGGRHA